jgi:hypothetical protein
MNSTRLKNSPRPSWIRATWIVLVVAIIAVIVPVAHSQGPFRVVKTVHFNVRYQRGINEADAKKVADYLQSDYQYISKKLGIDLKRSLDVRIYDSVGKFVMETRVNKPWRCGIYERRVLYLQPVEALEMRGLFEQTLSYELVHAVVDDISRMGCPMWLREAFAVYHSGEMANLSEPYGVRVSHFSDLQQDIQEYPDPPQRNDVHFVLGRTMKFFVDRFGEDKAFRLFAAYDGYSSSESVFRKVLHQEFSAIEKDWARYVGSHSGSLPGK